MIDTLNKAAIQWWLFSCSTNEGSLVKEGFINGVNELVR